MPPNTIQPLRVALVASSLKLAGAEKQTAYLARALFEAGADVRFFHLGEDGHYGTLLQRQGISLTQIYRRRRPLLMLARFSRALCQFRPAIVFAPQFGDLLQSGLAGRLCRALTLGGVRSDGFYELNSEGWRSPWMLRLAHGLVANSHHATQNLASRGVDPSRMRVLPNVLDLREFDQRSQLPPPVQVRPDRVMAVAVGSLQPSKRFDRFLQALAAARQKAPALFGVIAGADMGCRPALEQQAHQLGLAPSHVIFLGECDNIPALLAQAAFLVLCSDYEGFPNVILEAMAAGRPVITTAVGDAARIVLESLTGFVVAGGNVGAMSEHMVELAKAPATRTRLGTAGRRRVERAYNYESLPTQLLAVCRDFAVQIRRRQLENCLRGWLAAAPQRRHPGPPMPPPGWGGQTRPRSAATAEHLPGGLTYA